ncbi:hypothetical protein ACFO3J_35805 [Streptomyces polygonati]|uniref:Uncharacterized protein n=1 Tax=Streptomyces polygonati TaxID=1617087 RepID=A0ABV8I3Y9_9ACTN
MSTFNVNGPVNGPSQFGDGNFQVNSGDSGSTATALRLATQLVGQLGADAPPEAEEVRGELARAAAEGTAPDHRRIRAWLTTVAAGIGTGSGALALVEGIRSAVGS